MAAKHPEDLHGAASTNQENPDDLQYLSGLLEGNEIVSECQVVFEGEGDKLDTRHRQCIKNPGHPTFIPVSDFNIKHLPQALQTQESMDLIQKKIDQTVMVRVAYTSLKRPDKFSDSKAPYPFSKIKGSKKAVRYGTGSISRLLSSKPIKDRPCPCHLCLASGNPAKEFTLISVSTATHVIYDDSEAELATFDCFFDSEDKTNVKTLYGVSVDGTNTSHAGMYKSDVCEVVCVTHDSETVSRIKGVLLPLKNVMTMPHMYTSTLPPEGVIVSHPHGCSKRITIGKVKYLTVPVSPAYQTCTPFPLPQGTICHFKSTNGKNCQNKFAPLLQTEISIGMHPSSTDEGSAHSSTIMKPDTSGNFSSTKSKFEEKGEGYLDQGKNDPPSKSLSQALHEFYSQCTASSHLMSTEFSYSSSDRLALMTKVRENLSNTPLHLMPNKIFESILLQMETTTQTSKQCSGSEINLRENTAALAKDSVDIATEMIQCIIGSDANDGANESIISLLEILNNSASKLFDQTLAYNEQQMVWEGFFGKIGELIPSFAKNLTGNNPFINACANWMVESLEEHVSNETNQADDIDEYDSFDFSQIILQKMLGEIDIKARTALEHWGIANIINTNNRKFDKSKTPMRNFLPKDHFEIPSGVKILLPPNAEYAMRYYDENPGYFRFPPGTRVINAIKETIELVDGVEFRNTSFYPQYSYISYEIDTCPGSSGAAVYSNLLQNKFMTFFPHSGCTKDCSLSGIQENKVFCLNSHLMEGINTIVDNLDLD